MLYKLNKWLFEFIVKAEFDYAKNKQAKCAKKWSKYSNKYKYYSERRSYLNKILATIEVKEEVSSEVNN